MGFTPPFLDVRKVAGGWSVYGPSPTTTEDLTIYANTTDANPKIVLNGASTLDLGVPVDTAVAIKEGAVAILQFAKVTADSRVYVYCPIANYDLSLVPGSGTGRVRFGAYTAGAATDSTGYIEIKTSDGTTRKLMVQA